VNLVDARTRQETGAQLGVSIVIASEALLFAGLFALYLSYRMQYPQAFALGVRHDLRWLGSVNTAVLLTSSACVAGSLGQLAHGRVGRARALLVITILLGVVFLGLKGYEYASHIRDGIVPGGQSAWFTAHPEPGLSIFVGLYYLMTALHALHLMAGMTWLVCLLPRAGQGRAALPHLELAAGYWHFVDLLWVFLWPLFYLLVRSA
jgi:cytochrome c oxidase subunit 3